MTVIFLFQEVKKQLGRIPKIESIHRKDGTLRKGVEETLRVL